MLKCPLDTLDIIGGLANINCLILRVLHTKSEPALIIPSFPSTGLLREITIPDADADILIVKQSAIKLEKVHKMFTQVNLSVFTESLVLPLQMWNDQHRQEETRHTPMVGFIELSRFQEALQHEKQWS